MPTTEDRIKTYMSEYLADKEKRLQSDLSNSLMSMCLWAFLCGAIAAYSSTLPLIIGFTLGAATAHNKPEYINFVISWFHAIIAKIER
jgi:Sec-independent protein secretion pathway component TatC